MIPHRQEYPLWTTVCPLLADRRQACACWARAFAWLKFKTMHGGRTDLELISATMFRGPVSWLQPPASRTHLTPWMADCARCAWWSIDHDRRARSPFSVSVSAPRCCGFVTSRSQLRFVAVVGENDSLSFFFQAVTDRCAPAFGAIFLLVLGLKKKAPKRMVLKIHRRRVVLLSFFSPGTACNSSWRHSPSHANPCWLVAAIHPESTTTWPETKAIEHAPPFTGHEQGGRDFDFGNVSSPRPLIWLPSCFA